jgi:hypothetical protein
MLVSRGGRHVVCGLARRLGLPPGIRPEPFAVHCTTPLVTCVPNPANLKHIRPITGTRALHMRTRQPSARLVCLVAACLLATVSCTAKAAEKLEQQGGAEKQVPPRVAVTGLRTGCCTSDGGVDGPKIAAAVAGTGASGSTRDTRGHPHTPCHCVKGYLRPLQDWTSRGAAHAPGGSPAPEALALPAPKAVGKAPASVPTLTVGVGKIALDALGPAIGARSHTRPVHFWDRGRQDVRGGWATGKLASCCVARSCGGRDAATYCQLGLADGAREGGGPAPHQQAEPGKRQPCSPSATRGKRERNARGAGLRRNAWRSFASIRATSRPRRSLQGRLRKRAARQARGRPVFQRKPRPALPHEHTLRSDIVRAKRVLLHQRIGGATSGSCGWHGRVGRSAR